MKRIHVEWLSRALAVSRWAFVIALVGCAGAPSSPAVTTPSIDWHEYGMKGYELYSWQAGGQWIFALTVGTNHTGTYEELTTSAKSSTTSVRVQGPVRFMDVLGQLPSGAAIVWRGPQALRAVGLSPHNLVLPPDDLTDQIDTYSREAGLYLTIVSQRGATLPGMREALEDQALALDLPQHNWCPVHSGR